MTDRQTENAAVHTGESRRCVFCSIARGEAPAEVVYEWVDALAFRPLNPVTEGHTLVIPRAHVRDFKANPNITASVMDRAASLAFHMDDCNLITSAGPAATQTVFHLHVHLVPRREADGLVLPWT